MKITSDMKIFLVEFGKPCYSSYSSGQKEYYVIARNYEEAATKAREFHNFSENEKPQILDSDGSLRVGITQDEYADNVRSVKMITDTIVL